ncbi:hypothetical protein DUI87_08013 [Hirundo rustica rustica]|uniref:FHOD1 N-terminal GTPase-binding domain-containing protein n=1 Tax=Hirundo rustica rustica TaxID=333673 RepID=A0A3M0KRA9_HIRRU|nr:hypothetical protein DUI87_08013 [Hirundo rustica rustica]
MATLVCRVQLLDDTDPFNSTNFPEPTRPPLYTFREDIPLATQLAGVHRLLRAPQKVCKQIKCYQRIQKYVKLDMFKGKFKDNTKLDRIVDVLEVMEEPLRRNAMMDFVLTNKKGLVRNVKLKGSLSCSGQELFEFKILEAAKRLHSKLSALDFRRAVWPLQGAAQ